MIFKKSKYIWIILFFTITIVFLADTYTPRRVEKSYSNGIAVENNQIVNETGEVTLNGVWSKEISILNFSRNTVFKGTITFKEKTYTIDKCTLSDYRNKQRFISTVYDSSSKDDFIYYILMSPDFEQICLNSTIDRTYTIAPASTIDEYIKLDKLLND